MKLRLFRLVAIAVTGIVLSTLAADSPPAPPPVKIIFDTDIGNDVDDALALGLLHALADRGACELLGVTITRSDELADVRKKMLEYMENGARLGWLIDPQEQRVYIYRPGHALEVLDDPEIVSGDPVLPGFALELGGIFT